MPKRRILLVLFPVAAVVIVGLWIVLTREREPEYEGKKLSEWVDVWVHVYATPPSPAGDKQKELAATAIQHIGTNAIPYLLEWVMWETPAWRTNLSARFDPLLVRVKPSWQLKWDPRMNRTLGARRAFSSLGSAGEAAVTHLDAILKDRDARINRRMRAAWALAELGQAGFGSLLSAVKRGQFPPEVPASMYDTPETHAPSLLSHLREAVQSQDSVEREFAMRVLKALEKAKYYQ